MILKCQLFLLSYLLIRHFLPYQSFNQYLSILWYILFKPSDFPVLLFKEMFVLLLESLKMSSAYCPCHHCIYPNRLNILSMNYQELVWGLYAQWFKSQCESYNRWGTQNFINFRAASGPHCQRCFDPTDFLNSSQHIWLSLYTFTYCLKLKWP